ncbi:MAG: Pectate lyase, partial [Daejeonella sp.]|nr:Pectate lyase [Daejeonella sp.]
MNQRNTALLCMALLCASGCKKEQAAVNQTETTSKVQKNTASTSAISPIVTIGGSKFYVGGGAKEIFFNGINTAWLKQADYSLDFLGRNFDA